jgi:hypothetical protein
MRLLRHDHRSSGLEEQIWCDACQKTRERNGCATYGAYTLCNGCATDYELLRLGRSVRRIEDFFR